MKEIEAAALIAALILFALLACGAVSLAAIFLVPDAQAPASPESGSGPGPVLPVQNDTDETGISEQDLVIWSRITNPNVEAICLQKAKEEAGENSNLVYGCDCDEIEKEGIKTYRCDISTADPFTAYFANVDCYLARKECDIETNYGTQVVNFSQLGELG